MISSKYRFSLDIHSIQSQVSIPVSLGDTARVFYISLTDARKPFYIADGCMAKLSIKRPTGTYLEEFCIIKNNAIIKYDFSQNKNTAAVEGLHNCEVTLYSPNGKILTSPKFSIVVSKRAVSSDDIDLTDDNIKIIDSLVVAEASRVAAENERIAADAEREEIARRAEAAAERVKESLNGDRVFIRYSAYPDGRYYADTWQRGLNYIGVAAGINEPADASGYEWSVFAPGIYVGGGEMPDYADIQIDPDSEDIDYVVVQHTGGSQVAVMSQAATTKALDQLGGQVNALGQGLQQASGQMQEAVGQVQAAFADVYGRIDQMANGAETLFSNALRRVKESSVVVLDHAEDISPIGSLDDHLQVKLTGGFYDNTTIISNCDDLSGWSVYDHGSVVFSLDTEDKTEGTGCFRMDFSKDKKIRFTAIYRTGYYTKDISGANFLCFDCFVSDASKWNGKVMSIELSSDWSEDRREVQYDYTFSNLHDGWNRVVIPLTITDNRKTGFCRSGVSDEDYDPMQWKRLRFYMTETPNNADFTVKLDNLFFTGEEAYGRTISKESKTYLMVGGKNLLNPKELQNGVTCNGVTVQYNMADNSYVFNGTVEDNNTIVSFDGGKKYLVGGQTLTVSCRLDAAHSSENEKPCTLAVAITNALTGETRYPSISIHESGSTTIICDTEDVITGYSFNGTKGCSFDNYRIRLMLEVGGKASQTEEYKEFRTYPVAIDGSVAEKIETHSPYSVLRLVGDSVVSVYQSCGVKIRAEYNRDINKAFTELASIVDALVGG